MKTCKKIGSLLLVLLLVCGFAGMTFTSRAADAGEPSVRVTNSESEVIAEYKQTGYFEFRAENLPDGAAVHVFLNGEDRGESTYIYVNHPTEDYTVEAKILDRDGSAIASSGVIRVTVKNGFSDRVRSFFVYTVRSFFDGIADVVASFFVRILFFLFN